MNTRKNLPESCETKCIQPTNNVWTKINGNDWIYYVPGQDSITMLCKSRHSADAPVKGAGELVIETNRVNFYCCTVHFDNIKILFTNKCFLLLNT